MSERGRRRMTVTSLEAVKSGTSDKGKDPTATRPKVGTVSRPRSATSGMVRFDRRHCFSLEGAVLDGASRLVALPGVASQAAVAVGADVDGSVAPSARRALVYRHRNHPGWVMRVGLDP